MKCQVRRVLPVLTILALMLQLVAPAGAADPEIDRLLRSPVGKDWITNGGNLTNQRYSTLKQIDTSNVKQLKGAWMTRLKSSGLGGKYSFEATPLVKDGLMYIITGNDGKNVLIGGLGNDSMTGRAGEDSFAFNTALDAVNNVDTIAVVDGQITTPKVDTLTTELGCSG